MKWAGAGWAGGRVRIGWETHKRSRTPRIEEKKMENKEVKSASCHERLRRGEMRE